MRIQSFSYPVDVRKAVIWRYDNAEAIQTLLNTKEAWYLNNHTQFWNDWYTDVFNLDTANDFGLAVWSIILGVPLFIAAQPDPPGKPIFGFDNTDCYQNFDNGTFANLSGVIPLTTEQKRIVLKLRYFQLITRGAVPEINRFLNYVFAEDYGAVYVLDGLDMSLVYVFTFTPDQQLLNVLSAYDILPRPAGVLLKIRDTTRLSFGFDNQCYQNFDNGTFLDE